MTRYFTVSNGYNQVIHKDQRLNHSYLNMNTPSQIYSKNGWKRKESLISNEVTNFNKKYELRGVWITTVRNNDFPSVNVFGNEKFNLNLFKLEFLEIIEHCKKIKLNAIFFQVRPEGDAFYRSDINPWSAYLTGEQGVEPNWGNFDPLAWMIQVTHLAGIEFHAWFNPYRITPTTMKGGSKEELIESLSDTHYVRRHPDWVYFFNGQLYLDPGVPAVNQFMVDTVKEVLINYEVDAIHLDDFFYPYSYQTEVDGTLVTISFADESPDYSTFLQYHQQGENIHKWREANINNLVYNLSFTVKEYNKEYNKSVAFGISPFGVWASAEESGGLGSQTSPNQLSSLSEYVNSKLWVDSGWLDYVVPQNYWSFNDPLSPFHIVANWWNDVVAGTSTQLYMGLGLYLYEEDAQNPSWQNPEEIADQIRYLRTLENNDGYVFFTYHNLLPELSVNQALKEAVEIISNEIQYDFSLIPPRRNLQAGITNPILNLRTSKCDNDCNLLTFEDSQSSNSQYYVIYRIDGDGTHGVDITNPNNILDIIGKQEGVNLQQYTDNQALLAKTYTYAVTALSQAQVESIPIEVTT